MLGEAIFLASDAFRSKKDKGGDPYILHCLHVMNTCGYTGDVDVKIAAVLHDLLEDTDWTEDELLISFSKKSVDIIKRLTHDPEMSYDDYIKNISLCPYATAIKKADLRHNSDITRMKGLRKKDFDRLEKYHRAYMYLNN